MFRGGGGKDDPFSLTMDKGIVFGLGLRNLITALLLTVYSDSFFSSSKGQEQHSRGADDRVFGPHPCPMSNSTGHSTVCPRADKQWRRKMKK